MPAVRLQREPVPASGKNVLGGDVNAGDTELPIFGQHHPHLLGTAVEIKGAQFLQCQCVL